MKKAFLVFLALIMIGSAAVAEESEAYINIGDYGPEVVALHQKLANLGYFSLRPESPWSSKSADGLKAVRYVLGLDETGIVAGRTQYEAIMALDENLPQFAIKRIETIDEYLDYIREQKLTVFISAQDEASNKLQPSTQEKLEKLGLTTDWENMVRKAYIAIVKANTVVEELAATETTGAPLKIEGKLETIQYNVLSAGYENDGGRNSSIILNGYEYSKNRRGLNMVTMLNERIIDSVSFDTYGEEHATAKR